MMDRGLKRAAAGLLYKLWLGLFCRVRVGLGWRVLDTRRLFLFTGVLGALTPGEAVGDEE